MGFFFFAFFAIEHVCTYFPGIYTRKRQVTHEDFPPHLISKIDGWIEAAFGMRYVANVYKLEKSGIPEACSSERV